MSHAHKRQLAERQLIASAILAAVFAIAWLAAVLPTNLAPTLAYGSPSGHAAVQGHASVIVAE